MPFTSGFFNSINKDRRYDAVQLSSVFDGILTDGVFERWGDTFKVLPSGGMTVTIGTGRGWFNHLWCLNDTLYPITLPLSDPVLPRIDTLVIDVDRRITARVCQLMYVKGVPAASPVAPTLLHDQEHDQYPICDCRINANASSIASGNITMRIGMNSGQTRYARDSLAEELLYTHAWRHMAGGSDLFTTTLTDAAGDKALPTAGSAQAPQTLLQTIRNCLKWITARFDSNGNVPVAYGGTGGATASAAFQNLLTPTGAIANPAYFLSIATGYSVGWTSVAQAKTALGLGTIASYNAPLPIAQGGTGSSTAAGILTNLGLTGLSFPVTIAQGGTGATSALQFIINSFPTHQTTGNILVGSGFGSEPPGTAQFVGYMSRMTLRSYLGLGSNYDALQLAYGGTGVTSMAALRTAIYGVEQAGQLSYNPASSSSPGGSAYITNAGALIPSIGNGPDLGDSTIPWRRLYVVNTPNVTSDKREKENVGPIDFASSLIMGLNPVQFTRIPRSGVNSNKKINMGFIAQEVYSVLQEIGNVNLELVDRAPVMVNPDTDYELIDTTGYAEEDVHYGLGYTELIAPMISVIQSQQNEIQTLKDILARNNLT